MMSNNFRIMKAISLEMYKRMLEGCNNLKDSSIASTSAHKSEIGNPYGSNKSFNQAGTGAADKVMRESSFASSSLNELNDIPTTLYASPSVDDDPKVTLTLLRSIPDAQRHRARNLINTILNHPQFSWDDSGLIKYNNVIYPKTNIVDLISVATRSTKIRKLNIPGLSIFIQFLKSINIPRHYLGSHFSSLMDSESDKNDSLQNESHCPGWITYEDIIS